MQENMNTGLSFCSDLMGFIPEVDGLIEKLPDIVLLQENYVPMQ